MRNRVKPRGFFNIKTEVAQFLLKTGDRVFQRSVFAGNKSLRHCLHFLAVLKAGNHTGFWLIAPCILKAQ
ncbi:hypothetical protein DBO95_09885 [Yersinia pestis]|nr:hypothetical protein DBO95_09885 [Yersinia pestis]